MTENELIASMDAWLSGKKSPMAGFSDYMLVLARRNGIALTLSLAVAQAETQCATDPRMSSTDLSGHNAWGYGHPPGASHGYLFPSWPDSINSVTEHLANAYVYQGLTTVEEICPKWVGAYSQTWVDTVSQIIAQFGGNPEKLIRPPLAKEV